MEAMERDPSLPGARSPYLEEARSGFQAGERASEGRGCSWRGTLITDSAMGAFHSSLFTCGVIASIIEMDGTRGEKAAQFKASRFYTNALGVQAYCLRAEKQEVMLVTFNSVPRFGSYRTEVLLRQKDALLWLEIMNEKEDSQLRQQYIWNVRNCTRLVPPEEFKVHLRHTEDGELVRRSI